MIRRETLRIWTAGFIYIYKRKDCGGMQLQRILFFLEHTGKLSNNLVRHLYHFTHFYNAHFVTRCSQCSQLSKVPRFCFCVWLWVRMCVCVCVCLRRRELILSFQGRFVMKSTDVCVFIRIRWSNFHSQRFLLFFYWRISCCAFVTN